MTAFHFTCVSCGPSTAAHRQDHGPAGEGGGGGGFGDAYAAAVFVDEGAGDALEVPLGAGGVELEDLVLAGGDREVAGGGLAADDGGERDLVLLFVEVAHQDDELAFGLGVDAGEDDAGLFDGLGEAVGLDD